MTGPHGVPSVLPARVKTSAAVLTGTGLAGALAYIALVDPHRPGSLYPPCLFRALTGWNCPACGGLRMTHDLLHGQLAAAAHDNVFALLVIPMLTVGLLGARRFGWRVRSTAVVTALSVAMVAWTVLRNLPGFPLVPSLLAE